MFTKNNKMCKKINVSMPQYWKPSEFFHPYYTLMMLPKYTNSSKISFYSLMFAVLFTTVCVQ